MAIRMNLFISFNKIQKLLYVSMVLLEFMVSQLKLKNIILLIFTIAAFWLFPFQRINLQYGKGTLFDLSSNKFIAKLVECFCTVRFLKSSQWSSSVLLRQLITFQMLNDNSFRSLGCEGGSGKLKIQTLSFVRSQPLWNKSKGFMKQNSESACQINSKQRYKFYKTGKTFGFETCRYIQFNNGVLYYFQNEKDDKCKGYCNLQNVYMKYNKLQSGYELYLTNGKSFSSLIFNKNQFYPNFELSMAKSAIQLNFKEKYYIADLLGTGTFAKVYSAINIATKMKFAAKIMPKIDQNGFETKHLVQQQKRILKNLNSKNICKMQEFFEDSESYIFVLEFLQGKDLNVIMKQTTRQIPSEQKITILKSALNGLVDLHRKNIIHRDLKPHNIVVNLQNSTTKLVDFGLSLLYDNKTPLEKFIRCGTMGFIAPQIANNTELCRKTYTCKSDMFGFGIVAHMLLLGSNPLRGKTYKQTTQRNSKADIQLNDKQILEVYGIQCLQFLQNLLKKDPIKRWSAEQALQSSFLTNQHKSPSSASIRFREIDPEHDQINQFGSKQFGKLKYDKFSSSSKYEKFSSSSKKESFSGCKFNGLF